jgi:uncharacterized protein DUF4431
MTIILLFLTLIHPAPPTCLSYEPEVVKLTGTIRRHTFPGPPNYESIAKGDQAERVWLLHLAKPICVNASSEWEKATGVSAIELVLTKYDKSLVNHRVVVSGTLYHAHTAHHHTKVLLTVKDIRR